MNLRLLYQCLLLLLTPGAAFAQPVNDICATAVLLTSTQMPVCSNTPGTLSDATTTLPDPGASCATAGADVWYHFTAAAAYQIINLNNVEGSLTSAGVFITLYSGACTALTEVGCVTGITLNTDILNGGAGITAGQEYFLRIHTPATNPTSSGWGFDICVTHPAAASRHEYSRSYINVSKLTGGGTVNTGDVLEMRTTLVVYSGMVDSLAIADTIFTGSGLALVPGSLSLRTNEGKEYKTFTDAQDGDAGWAYSWGANTVVRINIGPEADQFNRGRLYSYSKPSVFGHTCIVMATYRVVVTAAYNSLINFKTGSLSLRDLATGVLQHVTFAPNNLVVYQSPGLCPNAVSAVNAVGDEFNGTFGAPAGAAPLIRNRGASTVTNHTYAIFGPGVGPNDNYYGVTNNTSAGYTTNNSLFKPDNTGGRLFGVWDITGDHTGASNQSLGNPACDTTQPVSPTNPCGYMLVVNASYKTDTAFRYTATNLCPNTYYEISAWIKNVCYQCGCDSNGVAALGNGYIPTALNDSSGVRPNIAFDVNGRDYYTTGDIVYTGVGPATSDATNTWVKRGFVYLTGPTETSFSLVLRNNAPGGGGNDWALDDIAITTCLPGMSYSPTLNPSTCQGNSLEVRDTIRSFFDTYTHYKWQRSTDGGTTWNNIAGASGNAGTPPLVGGNYEYVTAYTLTPSETTLANNGDRYRVIVATTSDNLNDINCQFTDGISIISLNVLNCTSLNFRLISFTGKRTGSKNALTWTTVQEDGAFVYSIERSTDGVYFTPVGTVKNLAQQAGATNQYRFTDDAAAGQQWHYRIKAVNSRGNTWYSGAIMLTGAQTSSNLLYSSNPFKDHIVFSVQTSGASPVVATLSSLSGAVVAQQGFSSAAGFRTLVWRNLEKLPAGIYVLRVQNVEHTSTHKLIKE